MVTKKILRVLLCVFFVYFPKEVLGSEPIISTISGNIATAKLTGKPVFLQFKLKICDVLIN